MSQSRAVVPRWEWRTFGERFGDAEDKFAALPTERVQESEELYLLSVADGDTVKVRDELMDVKHLERVNGDGLEQWRPVMKAAFPLSAADLRAVLEALGTAIPALEGEAYTLAQLLGQVVQPSPDLFALKVSKRRQRYTIGGCMAELSDVVTDRGSTRSIAVESEDAARLIETVQELGLASRPNVCYPRGLKVLAGFGARRYAVIDVGTNSVKFHLGERSADGAWQTIVDRAEITRLGEGLELTGRLRPTAIERTIESIVAMAEEARRAQAAAIAAVGTAGLRIASNAAEFVAAVQARCEIAVEVISGEEEARLAFLAATSALDSVRGSLVVFDTGGGSSQFTFGQGEHVDERFSLDVGAVRLTGQHGLDGVVPQETLQAVLETISADLSPLDGRAPPEVLVGMGGAVTNLVAVKYRLAAYDPQVVQGAVLDRAEVDRQIELYRVRTAENRRAVPGLQPQRAEVILAGACIVRTVMTKLGMDSLTVSDRGLRHGVLLERFGQ